MSIIQLAENRLLPDSVIRFGMRRLLRERLEQEQLLAGDRHDAALDRFAGRLRESAITIETHRANEQHYEVPAGFFEIVLGQRLKYSCGWWQDEGVTLDESEEEMLRLTCQRAGIENGMRILDLGCGWGSLALWIAEKYPDCQVQALSNSTTQRAFIQGRCQQQGLQNVSVMTSDVADFDTDQRFDRVVSVEMFEHVRNHEQLLSRISRWLVPDGKLFVHIFCHRDLAYTFETDGDRNWMGRHFFTGGIMPAEDLFFRFQRDLSVRQHWWINGLHYARTCENWLTRLDSSRHAAGQVLAAAASDESPRVLVQRWRMFFMACAELFRFDSGNQWGVGHYLFEVNESQCR